MKIKSSLIISLSIHFIIIITFVLFWPTSDLEEKDEKIRVELVVKENISEPKNNNILEVNDDILISAIKPLSNILPPESRVFLEENNRLTPDLIIKNRAWSEKKSDIGFDSEGFENSLNELIPVELVETDVESNTEISWEGRDRQVTYNSSIDFSSFPRESFTGVGVKVEFMVNPNGEVFSVNVLPPGSGSAEFDILIKQYVTKFKFDISEESSKGEIFIVYRK